MTTPPPDIDRALADLDSIRSHMAAGALFQGFGPLVMAGTGVLALITMGVQYVKPSFADPSFAYFATWIGAAVVCCLMVGAEMVLRSQRHHGGLADAMIIKAIEQFFQVGLAGAAIGFVFWRFAPDTMWTLPGLWEILVGVGIFASIRTLPKAIALIGVWYIMAGLIVLVLAATSRSVNPAYMGVPFSIGQFAMAAILHTASGENRE